eukprot:GGOE01027095.1.p2 GENE.GGOE01027095.1~~GGOE01027095.1.p2  ORF type:complete len:119 (-),score=5.41 GGOE01027095.1:143-499(-)
MCTVGPCGTAIKRMPHVPLMGIRLARVKCVPDTSAYSTTPIPTVLNPFAQQNVDCKVGSALAKATLLLSCCPILSSTTSHAARCFIIGLAGQSWHLPLHTHNAQRTVATCPSRLRFVE